MTADVERQRLVVDLVTSDAQRVIAAAKLDRHLCRFRAVSTVDHDCTSDVWIGSQAWEFKRPHGSGKNNVNNVFNQASERLRWRDDFDELIVVDRTRMRRFTKS